MVFVQSDQFVGGGYVAEVLLDISWLEEFEIHVWRVVRLFNRLIDSRLNHNFVSAIS